MFAPSSPDVHVRGIDRRLIVWLASLAGLAVVNVALWLWMAAAPPRTPYASAQLVLSAVYVGVCGFRALFPRVDLERVCVWDTWLSAIVLGRSAATVAELCFALQCGLFVHRLSEIANVAWLAAAAQAFLPLAIIAEIACWHAVLTLDHIGHAIEETLWAAIMLLLAASSTVAGLATGGALGWMLLAGAAVYGVGAGLTLAVDVTMYLARRRAWARAARLPLAAGLIDCGVRRTPTRAWEVWRPEVAWMTLYFSVGVWTSLAMVLLG